MSASEPALFVVLTTVDDSLDVDAFARTLVDERLAACVNILPPMRSVYRWQGRVESAEERQLVIKTAAPRLEAVKARIAALHAYEVPEILVLPVVEASAAYRSWLLDALG